MTTITHAGTIARGWNVKTWHSGGRRLGSRRGEGLRQKLWPLLSKSRLRAVRLSLATQTRAMRGHCFIDDSCWARDDAFIEFDRSQPVEALPKQRNWIEQRKAVDSQTVPAELVQQQSRFNPGLSRDFLGAAATCVRRRESNGHLIMGRAT